MPLLGVFRQSLLSAALHAGTGQAHTMTLEDEKGLRDGVSALSVDFLGPEGQKSEAFCMEQQRSPGKNPGSRLLGT